MLKEMIKEIILYPWTKYILWGIEFFFGVILFYFLGQLAFIIEPHILGLIFLLIVGYFYFLLARWIVNYFTTLKLTPIQLNQIFEKRNFSEGGEVYQVENISNWLVYPQQQVIHIQGKLTILRSSNLLSLNFFTICPINYYGANLMPHLPESVEAGKEKSIRLHWILFHLILLIYFSLFLSIAVSKMIEQNTKVKELDLENSENQSQREKDIVKLIALYEINGKKEPSPKIKKFINLLKTKSFPAEVKERLQEEIDKLIKGGFGPRDDIKEEWISWVTSLPWYQTSEENWDLSSAKKALNSRHYGLEKIKKRIIDYLAVSKRMKKSSGRVICFVGPPGVGKTSLSRSIAEALNRNYQKISLGGISDESEIRGHRIVYIAAKPGRIIEAMKNSGVKNPVIVLDEIDKIEKSGIRGDPAAALLEILDPEQNHEFRDHFIEEKFDLSQVMFICTANYLPAIPAPLRDRLEIIELSSYTEQEKFHIAKKYLIPAVLKEKNLEGFLTFDDSAIKEIINYYTREAGTRELNRLISEVANQVGSKLEQGELKSENINQAKVSKYLGVRHFSYGEINKQTELGIVNGLAYTEFGGDILQITVVRFPVSKGGGKLILTGKLGEVMKESAQVAFDYVRYHCSEFGINPRSFEEYDYHFHVPEGAVPKEGPSAGSALTTALISLLTQQPIPADIGMTGEITLHGQILPIGGLKEKAIAARRSGLKAILIPSKNEKDIEDIPQEVRNELKIIPVSEYQTLWQDVKKRI